MSNDEYHLAAAPDVSGQANRHIWLYFVLLGILLFVTMGGLTIMFRFQVAEQQQKKIGAVKSQEALDYEASANAIIAGRKGVVEGKKNVSFEVAKARFLTEINAKIE
jgi:hypothetical protein